MIRQKRNHKGIILVSILIILILFSNFTNFTGNNPMMDENNSTIPFNKEKNEHPKSSNYNLTSYITGNGVNQTVRAYMTNQSSALDNENGYFNISAPADNMYLNSGDFEFNFNNNYTTEYVVEGDSALYPEDYFEEYKFVEANSNLTIKEGTPSPIGSYNDLIEEPDTTYWNISSSDVGGAQTVDFTILANFSGVVGRGDPDDGTDKLDFNRTNIIGFILNFTQNVFIYGSDNHYVDVSVKIRDFYHDEWRTIIDNTGINYTLGKRKIDKIIIDENLGSINDSDCTLIRFIYNRTAVPGFNVSLHEFDFKAITIIELPIAEDNWVALEFDLRGINSTVNGFYAWIRTLDLDKAKNGNLTISLYRANNSMRPTDGNLRESPFPTPTIIKPDLTEPPVDSMVLTFDDYHNDTLTYFKFDTTNTDNLSRYNYYIVIKSNTSKGVYSLVTVPGAKSRYGDGEVVDHQIKTSINGDDWVIARSSLNIRAEFLYLDAHLFKLNIKRGYMASDFEINGNRTLRINDQEFENGFYIDYGDSPILKWGVGRWNHNFTDPIEINGNNFPVKLTWNTTEIKGFKFDVNYTAIAYRVENATTEYRVSYDFDLKEGAPDPEWIFNYSLNLDKFDIYNWNFTQFWFIYPNYFTAHNLTTPNGTEIFSQTRESSMENMPGYLKVILSTSIINTSLSERAEYNGTYSLYLTGFNAIKDSGMHSYINYNEILWESNGFMYGDNISISADIQGPNNLAPKSGFVNVSLYYPYPNGTLVNNLEYTNGNLSKDETLLSYDFNKQTIYNITKKDIPVQGTYYLGYFWTNDSIVGYNKMPIYIDSYELVLENCTFDRIAEKYLLAGTVQLNISKDYPYGAEMLIAIVNETTGEYNPNFYPVNNSISPDEGSFSYKQDYNEYEFEIEMSNFKQNETILNPNEEINIKTTIQNRDLNYDVDVKIEVLLVSYINEEWIINSTTSITKNLKSLGQAGDTEIFSVDLALPSFDENDLTWDGVNAPIRQGGAKTVINVYIKDNYAGTYISEDYSLLIPVEDDIYEGYVVALKEPVSSRVILQYFEKDECAYLPENCTFIANVVNKDYMSIYNLVNFSIGLKSPIKFWNITVNPEEPIEGKTFTISTNLATEFDKPLLNKEVFCQYYDGDSWINITSGNTGSNGLTNLIVDTSITKINAIVSKSFRLLWMGDNETLNGTKNLNVDIIVQTNSIRLSSEDDESFLYKNTVSIIEVSLKNNGNSILKILEINIDIDVGNVDYEIKGEDNTILDRFISGESTTITIELEVGVVDSDDMDFDIEIIAVNIISGEIIVISKTIDLDLIDKPFYDYSIEYFIYIMLAIIAIIGIRALFYYRSTKKKLEKQVKEAEKKRPRKGRYVKVSELKLERPEIEEKEVEKEEEIKEIEEKKTIDLDELLEEEFKPEVKTIEKVEEAPAKKPPKKVELPPKKIKKEPKKKEKPTKGRISTRQMVEQKKKKKKKKKTPKKVKKAKKSKPKQALRKKKQEPKKDKKEKTTDFDSLLEKEGLGDKK